MKQKFLFTIGILLAGALSLGIALFPEDPLIEPAMAESAAQ